LVIFTTTVMFFAGVTSPGDADVCGAAVVVDSGRAVVTAVVVMPALPALTVELIMEALDEGIHTAGGPQQDTLHFVPTKSTEMFVSLVVPAHCT
jgi:hypothetical protein